MVLCVADAGNLVVRVVMSEAEAVVMFGCSDDSSCPQQPG